LARLSGQQTTTNALTAQTETKDLAAL